MRDDETGAAFHQPEQGLLYAHLCAGIHAAGSLVENQNTWIGQNGAGDGQQLPLPLAQVAAALRKLRVVTLGQAADELVRVRQFGGGNDLFVGSIEPPVADVLCHRL